MSESEFPRRNKDFMEGEDPRNRFIFLMSEAIKIRKAEKTKDIAEQETFLREEFDAFLYKEAKRILDTLKKIKTESYEKEEIYDYEYNNGKTSGRSDFITNWMGFYIGNLRREPNLREIQKKLKDSIRSAFGSETLFLGEEINKLKIREDILELLEEYARTAANPKSSENEVKEKQKILIDAVQKENLTAVQIESINKASEIAQEVLTMQEMLKSFYGEDEGENLKDIYNLYRVLNRAVYMRFSQNPKHKPLFNFTNTGVLLDSFTENKEKVRKFFAAPGPTEIPLDISKKTETEESEKEILELKEWSDKKIKELEKAAERTAELLYQKAEGSLRNKGLVFKYSERQKELAEEIMGDFFSKYPKERIEKYRREAIRNYWIKHKKDKELKTKTAKEIFDEITAELNIMRDTDVVNKLMVCDIKEEIENLKAKREKDIEKMFVSNRGFNDNVMNILKTINTDSRQIEYLKKEIEFLKNNPQEREVLSKESLKALVLIYEISRFAKEAEYLREKIEKINRVKRGAKKKKKAKPAKEEEETRKKKRGRYEKDVFLLRSEARTLEDYVKELETELEEREIKIELRK